jgi:hypothetical protein
MERPKLKLSSKITAILGKHITNITKRLAIDLICPISRELFEDPVICAGDGQTYERKEIEEWFEKSEMSPFDTSKPLTSKTLIPNIAVRKLADAVRVEKLETTRTDEVPELKVAEAEDGNTYDDGVDTAREQVADMFADFLYAFRHKYEDRMKNLWEDINTDLWEFNDDRVCDW